MSAKRGVTLLLGAAATGFLCYMLFSRFPDIRRNVAARDSLAYWSAGRLLIQGQNPYDHPQVFRLEREHGYSDERPLVLRTPPWSLFMVVPLGPLSPFGAWLCWMAFSFGSLLAAMRFCRTLYGQCTPRDLVSAVGYTFAPIPACLVSGQMGLVLLLGIVLFLWWERERPFWAGAVLILPFAKPHLLSLFWITLFLWVVARKKRELALGFICAFLSAIAIALLFNVRVFQDYREMLRTASIAHEFIPALSGVLRLIFFHRLFWVQFVPIAGGLVWCVSFFWRNFANWTWTEHGPALLIVSVLTTPYSWLADESVLLPAILQGAAFAYQARAQMKVRTKLALIVFSLLNMLLLLILRSKIPFATGIYFWSSLVWFSWYFFARGLHSRPVEEGKA